MEPWIFISIAAAFFQTLRFMLQKQLVAGALTATGATFSRFVYAAPLVLVAMTLYGIWTAQNLPGLSGTFLIAASIGGIAQILATIAVVALFATRNFAVGITFKKTEVILTALVGFIVLGDRISAFGLVALLIGLLGVILLSDRPENAGRMRLSIWNKAAGLGVLSGIFFAVSAVAYRAASLSLDGGDAVFRAGITLVVVTALQTALLWGWLRLRDPEQITRTFAMWRKTGLVGLSSMAGSYCWFLAFTLQSAAYVFAVGQIEVIFSFLIGLMVFRETSSPREIGGIALLTLSILVLILFG